MNDEARSVVSAVGATGDWHNASEAQNTPSVPRIVDRAAFQTELDALRVREKAHTHEGDAIAAARRRLPMVEVDASMPLVSSRGRITSLTLSSGADS